MRSVALGLKDFNVPTAAPVGSGCRLASRSRHIAMNSMSSMSSSSNSRKNSLFYVYQSVFMVHANPPASRTQMRNSVSAVAKMVLLERAAQLSAAQNGA